MRSIAIALQKGGVGKSTTASCLGSALILKGYRVLFVDLDAQGNLTYSLGASDKGPGAMGVLQRPETIKDEIQHTPQGDVLPSSPALAGADTVLTTTGKEYRLREALETVEGSYDYCIIDTPPALGITSINALTAADGVIIPTQADVYALQGIGQLYDTVGAVQRYCNPGLKILGILLTRYNGRSTIRREVAEALGDLAEKMNTRLYETRIRENVALVEAAARRQNIYQYAPRTNGAADYMAFTEEFLSHEG